MKKYFISLITILVASLLTSCNDALELEYDGRSSLEELFATKNGVMGYLNSCYMARIMPDINRATLTDDSQSSESVSQGSLTSLWYADAFSASNYSNVDGQPWGILYQAIRKCNVFLQRMQGASPEDLASLEAEVTSWVAQAHTLRAFYYLQLIKRYGAVPLLINPYEITHDYSKDVRTPVSEIVKQILADCDAAMSASESTQGFSWTVGEGQNFIMNRAVVQAIRSQAILYAASPLFNDGTYTWNQAMEITGDALSNLLSHDYKLWNEQGSLMRLTEPTVQETISRRWSMDRSFWRGTKISKATITNLYGWHQKKGSSMPCSNNRSIRGATCNFLFRCREGNISP